MKTIVISDPTLRDGNHAVRHQVSIDQIAGYCRVADKAGIPIIEVGHGNGIGASSLHLGHARCSDAQMITTARSNLQNARLGIHMIPGFATIKRDLAPALTLGVNVVRVATHCTEADISLRYIEFVRKQGATAYGVLMMSHMASPSELARQARLMESAGAESVILMDSAGYFLPTDVKDRIAMLAVALGIPVGFHAHNNLGLAIANSLAAVEAGATMIDGTARGFGAGAGNAALEQLVPVLSRYGYDTGIDLYGVLDVADYAAADLAREAPNTTSIGIISSLAGVFSGFATPVLRAARETGVDPRQIIAELGRRKILAGQEDSIVEVAIELSKNTNPNVSIPAMVNDNPVSNTNLRP